MRDKIIDAICVSFFSSLLTILLPILYPTKYLTPIIGATIGGLLGCLISIIIARLIGVEAAQTNKIVYNRNTSNRSRGDRIFTFLGYTIFFASVLTFGIAMMKERSSDIQYIISDYQRRDILLCLVDAIGFAFIYLSISFVYILTLTGAIDYVITPFNTVYTASFLMLLVDLFISIASLFNLWYSLIICPILLLTWLLNKRRESKRIRLAS